MNTLIAILFAAQVSLSDPGFVAGLSPVVEGASIIYLLDEDFEGAGTPTDWTVFNTPNFDHTTSPAPLAGSESLCLTNETAYTTTPTFSGGATAWFKGTANIGAVVGGTTTYVSFRNGTSIIGSVALRSTGVWQISHGATTLTGGTYTSGTYYIWVRYLTGSGTDGEMDLYIAESDSFPEAATLSIPNGTSTADMDNLRLPGNAYFEAIWDDTKVSVSQIP